VKRTSSVRFGTSQKAILGCGVILWIAAAAYANLFVGGATHHGTQAIGEYTNSGVALNPNLVTGFGFARDIAISGNKIYVLTGDGRVGVYSTSGQTINPSLITGLDSDHGGPQAIVISGDRIFVGSDAGHGSVSLYTTSGTLVNPSLISGLQPSFRSAELGDLAVFGGNLYVASWASDNGLFFQGTVGEYNFSGTPIAPSLISFTGGAATALAVSETNIYVRNSTNAEEPGIDSIAEYTHSGTLVNPSFITGLTDPFGIVISGNDIFVAGGSIIGGVVGRYNLSGEPIDPTLITNAEFPTIAVAGPSTDVPESLATWWLALPLLGILLARRFERLLIRYGN